MDKKKPDPKIYNVAAQKLGLDPADCLVVEDSTIGLQAALGAGMRCIITYTPSTKQQVRICSDVGVCVCVCAGLWRFGLSLLEFCLSQVPELLMLFQAVSCADALCQPCRL